MKKIILLISFLTMNLMTAKSNDVLLISNHLIKTRPHEVFKVNFPGTPENTPPCNTPAPTGNANQTFCNSATVANLVATGTAIQWYDAATGGNLLSSTTALTTATTYYASQTSGGCESTTRLAVTVTITVVATPTGNASQTICNSGTINNLVATGTGPSLIRWYAAATGGTQLAGNTALVDGTTYYASQTTGTCSSGVRLAVTVTITTTPAPTGNATQTFCSGATIANLQATGSTIEWFAAATGGTALATTTTLVNNSTYYATQTVNGCRSATRLPVTVTVIPGTPAPTGAAAQSFCAAALISDLQATGTAIQWYDAATGGNLLAPTTALVSGTIYYASQTLNACESPTRLAVTYTLINTTAPTGMSNQSICLGATIADLQVTGTSIQWYTAAVGGNPLATTTVLVNGTTYYASQTANGCESQTRLAVTYTSAPTPPPTAVATQNFCSNATLANVVISGANLQWYDAATGGNLLPSTTLLVNGTTYYASQTAGGCTSNRTGVTTIVNVTPSAPTAAATQSFCTSATISDLQVSGTSIQWNDAATGGNLLTSSTAVTSGTTYYASSNNNGCASPRTAVTVTVYSATGSPTGNANQTFCNSATVANLTATGTAIQWYDAATGGNLLTSTTVLVSGTTYYATQTLNGCESPTRLAVAVTINVTATPTGNATQTFCNAGTINNLVATGTAAIRWFAAATGGTQLGGNTALVDGTTYYASQTIGTCASAVRLAVTVVITVTPAPTGSTTQTYCSGATVADLQATGSTINWFAGATGGTALATTTTLVNNTTYYATQTVNGCRSTPRLPVTVTVTPATAAPSGTATQTFCTSAMISNLQVTGTSIQWYDAATGGNLLSSTTVLVSGTTYYASQTLNACESPTRFAVTYILASTPAPTGSTAQSLCNGATIADLQVTGTSIQWYDAAIGGNLLPFTTLLVNGTTYYASQTINACESAVRLAVTYTAAPTPAPTASSTQSFCSNATLADVVITGVNIQWYDAATGGNLLPTTTLLVDGTTYYASQTAGGCTSTRTSITTTVNVTPSAPTAVAVQSFCTSATIGDIQVSGSSIQWYDAATGGNILTSSTAVTTGTTYYASQINNGCISPRTAVAVTVYSTTGTPTGNANQTFCNSATVANLTATGTAIKWYDAATGGNLLPSTTALITATTYYATQTLNGCESPTRLAVNVTITVVAPPTGNALQTICNAGTINNLVATGTGLNLIRWYAAATGGTQLPGNTALVDGTTYYASQTTGTCSSGVRLAVTVSITITPAPTGNTAQTFCSGATVADLQASGSTIQWFAAATGGTALGTTTTLVNNTTYYATQTVNGCRSATRLPVTVTVTPTTPAPSGTATQSFCISAMISDLQVNGTAIQWYDAATAGNLLAPTTALVSGTTYYASQTLNACESLTRLAILVNITSVTAPTGSASQSLCIGAILSDLQASGTTIQWYATATGGTALSPTTALVNGTTYYASQTINGCVSPTRLAVTYTAAPTPPPTATATQSFCSNATLANIVIAGANIQWYTAATGGTALINTTPLVSASTYYASQTAGGCTSTRTAVTATVNVTPAAPVAAATQTFCSGAAVANLVATGTAIQWYDAATGGNLLSSTAALVNGNSYYASQTTTICESQRTQVVVTVAAPTPAPTGNANQTFCNSGTVANLAATGTAIQWYDAATGGNLLSSTTALTTATTYYASQTLNGCESPTRLAVIVTITVVATPTGSTTQTICNAGTINNLVATGTGLIRWYAAATGGTQLPGNTALVDGTTYYASQTTGTCSSGVRLAVAVSITITPAPTGNTTQTVCSGATVADLQATGSTIQWFATATGGTALATTTALANNTSYYATQTVNGCRSATRLAVAVSVTAATPAPTGTAAQTYCSGATVVNLQATGTTIQWYDAATGGNLLSPTNSLVNGTTYYASQTLNACESQTRFGVTVTITVTNSPTGSTSQSFCTAAAIANLLATGTTIQWYATATGGTALSPTIALVNGTTYYASQTVNGCESPTRLAVTATITTTNAPSGSATQTFCTAAAIANLLATGTTIQWYATATGGTALSPTIALVNGTTYYASQTVNGCESPTRLAVTATITTTNAPSGSATQSFCSGAAVANLLATGTTIQWYATAIGGSALSPTIALANGTTYYASQTVNGCESPTRLAVIVSITTVAPPTGAATQNFNSGDTLTVLVVNGTNIQWYATATGGTALPSTTTLVNGTTYYATQSINGCVSPVRLAVTVQIQLSTPTEDKISFNYSPNPVKGILTIQANENLKSVSIINLMGQTIATQNFDQEIVHLDMSFLPTGTYFIKIQGEIKQSTLKVIKE